MTCRVYQHWDPLKVCVVGKSYPPEFYSWIKSSRLRSLFERIAIETEEDYQNLIKTLAKFNIEIIRPAVPKVMVEEYLTKRQRIPGPISMNPRDQMIMVGEKFFLYPYDQISIKTSGRNIPKAEWTPAFYHRVKQSHWPQDFIAFDKLSADIRAQLAMSYPESNFYKTGEDHDEIANKASKFDWWSPILDQVKKSGNEIVTNFYDNALNAIPANGITRIGKDLYFGCESHSNVQYLQENIARKYFSDYRCHFITTGGHIDGCFTPVSPGLIVSTRNMPTYSKTFPGWEVVYLEGESWSKVQPFLDLKEKNQGRWWIKGSEYDTELIEYVETWLRDWTGYVEESVFDVNILVVDKKNIIVNGYNKQAFGAFDRYGITPHICPMRHRYFWDGGIHCVTLDLHREGKMEDYFPERNNV